MQFEKWQALGNDYLIVEQDRLPWELTPARVRALCAGHTGVFSDGILLLSRSERPGCVADLRIFNPDGSESGLSGNGSRQAALYLRRHGWATADAFAIATPSGVVHPTITSPTTVTMALGRAATSSPDYPSGQPDGRGELSADGATWSFRHVQVGNPQCAIRVGREDTLARLDLAAIGGAIERHELFPHRTNVSWYVPLAEDRIRARIFERGVGETDASGTGATGAAVAHVLEGGRSPVTVALDGGELEVGVGGELELTLSGWALPVFAGTLSDEFVKELHETE
ncbi:MAG: diaminopimelate epimerase [Solirubrobacteraceae bacterium]